MKHATKSRDLLYNNGIYRNPLQRYRAILTMVTRATLARSPYCPEPGVLKYPHSEFHFNLMNTASMTAHFCRKVCAAMLAVDSGVLSTIRSATLPGAGACLLKSAIIGCLHPGPALGGMVRVTCHTEISQNTVTQAYS